MTDETVAEWRARTERRADLPLDDVVWPDTTTAPLAVAERAVPAARGIVLLGGDISHHQGDIDISRLNVSYLWAKATEVGFVDGKFARNRQAASRAGVPFGSYSFLRPGVNVTSAVDAWYRVAGPVRSGDLRPALDVEVPGFSASEVHAYVVEVERRFGCKPVVYIATDIYRQPGMSVAVSGCTLWIPRYGGLPAIPWDVHQFTDAMRTPAGSIDGNHTARLDLCLVPGSVQPTPDPPHVYNPKLDHGGSKMGFPHAVAACSAPNGGTWVVGLDGGVGTYGGAPFLGSYPGLPPSARQGDRVFIGIEPHGNGYRLLADTGETYDFPVAK